MDGWMDEWMNFFSIGDEEEEKEEEEEESCKK